MEIIMRTVIDIPDTQYEMNGIVLNGLKKVHNVIPWLGPRDPVSREINRAFNFRNINILYLNCCSRSRGQATG